MTLDIDANAALDAPQNDWRASFDPARQSCGRYRWYVVLTKHGQREIAEASLSQDGWNTFFPLMVDNRQRHGNRLVSLFGQYSFLQIPDGDIGWPRIFSTRGVFTLLCRRDRVTRISQPLPLPVGVIEDLQARTSARRVVDDPGEHPEASRMRAGALGSVVAGPWAGWEGVCTLSRRDRLTLLLRLFGRVVPVEFRLDQVRAA